MSTQSDPQLALRHVVAAALKVAFGDEGEAVVASGATLVRRSDRADFQVDLALSLARTLKKKPRDIAEALSTAITVGEGSILERIEIAGPGFLNLTVNAAWLAAACDRVLSDPRLGVPEDAVKERVVIDYSAPNVAKEMHVGHLRSTVIGDSLARVLTFMGHTVIRQNHLGDWGTPFGMLIEHLIDTAGDADSATSDLSAFYRAARAKFDSDPTFQKRARDRVVSLQSGDAETLARWKSLVAISTGYFQSIYDRLGTTLTPENIAGESLYNPRLAPLAKELEDSGKAKINDGALCFFPAGFTNKEGDPLPLIVRKTDGGFGYAATDLVAIRYRLNDLKATRLLYVVGAPQSQHLEMIFAAARELGWLSLPARAEHVAFGSVLGADRKMFKSRSGETVKLTDLIDDAEARALAIVVDKVSDAGGDERKALAHALGVGSIKYADLSSDRVKDYIFDLDRMISFDGNTAGYLQYAHARVRSIFRKAGDEGALGAIQITHPAEKALALEVLSFPSVLAGVAESLEPHRLAGFLYALAGAFTRFYDQCPVLKETGAVRASRLALSELTAKTLAGGLDLLGIEAPLRM